MVKIQTAFWLDNKPQHIMLIFYLLAMLLSNAQKLPIMLNIVSVTTTIMYATV